jgi:molybdopterin molybdotransferase
MLSFEAARNKVIEVCGRHATPYRTEVDICADFARALGRVLAVDVLADRDYPPFNRSTRDGYAVRAADVAQAGAKLRLIGESRAGVAFDGTVGHGECVRILTGAAVPDGANAVIMQEHARAEGQFVTFKCACVEGQNFVPAGAEAKAGRPVVSYGARLGYAELATVAQVGHTRLAVTRRPRVSILSTGDEIVGVNQSPGPFQIRNSNSISLAAQVLLAGALPNIIGNARDDVAELRGRILQGLESDILVLSGGVSVGTYDLAKQVLLELGTEFSFEGVAIRPGRPAVFGWCRGKPVFGLPGNPVSTMVTFELFVVPAIEILSGTTPRPLPFFKAKLARDISEKPPLAHFLPAFVSWPGGEPQVDTIQWQGSGDIGAVARGNCFLVVRDERQQIKAGEWVDVLPRRGIF